LPSVEVENESIPPVLAGTVIMVRPASFGANPQTRASNRFQGRGEGDEIREAARREFDQLVFNLDRAGIAVLILEDTLYPSKPDAVFPNNWFSTDNTGRIFLYPMQAPNRRSERRISDLKHLLETHGYAVHEVIDISHWERQGLALEGTGSLVLDRVRQVAYACRSVRTCTEPFEEWTRYTGYKPIEFTALGPDRMPIYHTNVMLALGREFAVLGESLVTDPQERTYLRHHLENSGLELLLLDPEVIGRFGANILHLEGSKGAVIAMSETARAALGTSMAGRLERYGNLVVTPIPTIEHAGGGSVRCMLGEIFLPRVQNRGPGGFRAGLPGKSSLVAAVPTR